MSRTEFFFSLFCRILLTGGFPGLNVSMNGMMLLEWLGCEVLICSRSCLLVLAAFVLLVLSVVTDSLSLGVFS